jgi:hypothetical protein
MLRRILAVAPFLALFGCVDLGNPRISDEAITISYSAGVLEVRPPLPLNHTKHARAMLTARWHREAQVICQGTYAGVPSERIEIGCADGVDHSGMRTGHCYTKLHLVTGDVACHGSGG